MNQTNPLGTFIRDKRIEKKMTQRQLAIAAGFKSSGTVSDIENGFRYPGEEFLPALADALGISLADLQKYDDRLPVRAAQTAVRSHPDLAGVLRRVVESAKHIPADELARRIDAALQSDDPNQPPKSPPTS